MQLLQSQLISTMPKDKLQRMQELLLV